jgi:sulfide:quinone oxidoreductase
VDRFRVVICGGGIAAVEGLARLRTLAGDAVDVTVVAPNEEFRYRPLAVDEPFARPGIRRYPMRQITDRTQSEWIQDAGEWVDLSAQVLHTEAGAELRFDALLLAVGGRLVMPFEHVTVFDDEHADEGYHGIIQDIEGGYTRSVVLVVPEGHAWLLPAYELALMTAERADSMWEEGLGVTVVTPEPAPLAALGEEASAAISDLLERSRVRVYTNARPTVHTKQHVLVKPDGPELEAERIVALPRIEGRPLRGVPSEAGFVPVDEFSRVPGTAGHVFAAGDDTDLPLKHGSLGAQQADVAAAGIAAMAGVGVEPEPLHPVVRALLHTGKQPLYITARMENGRVESEVTTEQAWPPDEKVVARELGSFLASLD